MFKHDIWRVFIVNNTEKTSKRHDPRCSLKDVPSCIHKLNKRCFKSNLLVKLFIMHGLSSLHHIPAMVSSSTTSVMIWFSKARINVECAFSSRVAISSSRGFGVGFNKDVHRSCYLNNARFLICHKLKLFLIVNLSTFKLLPPAIIPA